MTRFKNLLGVALLVVTLCYVPTIFATTTPKTPQPTTCVTATFSESGSQYWSKVSIVLRNNCGMSVDLQNSTFTFASSDSLNTSFWGTFGTLAYPTNTLQITSQASGTHLYTASLSLQFPQESWANTKLPNGQSITLTYSAANGNYDASSAKLYLSGSQPAQVGNINLSNSTAQPANVSQTYAAVNIVSDGTTITTSQVPWSGTFQATGLAPGAYTLQPVSVTDSSGNSYQGTANPSQVTVVANASVPTTISYQEIIQSGSVKIQMPVLPGLLTGYTTNPTIVLTRSDTGATVSQISAWNAVTTATPLANNMTYALSTPVINYNGASCTATISPVSVTSSSKTPPTAAVSYACVPAKQDVVTLSVSGAPSSTSSVIATLTPSNGASPVNSTIDLSNGTGASTVNLSNGVIYNVSLANISGYSATITPQPLTAGSHAKVTMAYQQATGGRVIAYLPGWKTPPTAQSLQAAGYTHIIVAFGVFGSTPANVGQIVSTFDTVSAAYIASLHAAGIKVLLSLGGASTSVAGTDVNFHNILANATAKGMTTAQFQMALIASIHSFVTQYGFDGIDFDIESGLGFGAGGTYANPGGDIAVLASIINQLHTTYPNLLISMAPQTANISPTAGMDGTWGNYASLIMQTHQSISWVGIQLYNTGCTFGLDQFCYPDANSATDQTNYSVAMAAGLLENWPATTSSGQATGFQPYISYLKPEQVVLGYPAPNTGGIVGVCSASNSNSDGSPAACIASVKKAVQCLRTGSTGCDTYKPPRAYPNIGGVFNWEVNYDQQNNFGFATGLKNCVINGDC